MFVDKISSVLGDSDGWDFPDPDWDIKDFTPRKIYATTREENKWQSWTQLLEEHMTASDILGPLGGALGGQKVGKWLKDMQRPGQVPVYARMIDEIADPEQRLIQNIFGGKFQLNTENATAAGLIGLKIALMSAGYGNMLPNLGSNTLKALTPIVLPWLDKQSGKLSGKLLKTRVGDFDKNFRTAMQRFARGGYMTKVGWPINPAFG